MEKECAIVLSDMMNKLNKIEQDIQDLKSFKNRVLGGLAVFCFVLNLVFKQMMN